VPAQSVPGGRPQPRPPVTTMASAAATVAAAGGVSRAQAQQQEGWQSRGRSARWAMTEEELRAQPSIADNVRPETIVARKYEAYVFIDAVRTELKLPRLVTWTAMTLLHRFYVHQSFTDFDWRSMSCVPRRRARIRTHAETRARAHIYTDTQTPTHADMQTPTHADMQTPTHADMQTPTHADPHRHADTLTCRHPPTLTCRHLLTLTCRHPRMPTHTDTLTR